LLQNLLHLLGVPVTNIEFNRHLSLVDVLLWTVTGDVRFDAFAIANLIRDIMRCQSVIIIAIIVSKRVNGFIVERLLELLLAFFIRSDDILRCWWCELNLLQLGVVGTRWRLSIGIASDISSVWIQPIPATDNLLTFILRTDFIVRVEPSLCLRIQLRQSWQSEDQSDVVITDQLQRLIELYLSRVVPRSLAHARACLI